eukprot:SAG11_NODE_15_length_26319_cov_13.810564_16_plen_69_part_00
MALADPPEPVVVPELGVVHGRRGYGPADQAIEVFEIGLTKELCVELATRAMCEQEVCEQWRSLGETII